MEKIKLLPLGEIAKAYVFATLYFFMMVIVGVLAVTVYGYFYPFDLASEISVLTAALIFFSMVLIDFGLLFFSKPTPTIIAILIVLAPILVIYKLLKNTDLIQIDQDMPAKVKNYVPPRVIGA